MSKKKTLKKSEKVAVVVSEVDLSEGSVDLPSVEVEAKDEELDAALDGLEEDDKKPKTDDLKDVKTARFDPETGSSFFASDAELDEEKLETDEITDEELAELNDPAEEEDSFSLGGVPDYFEFDEQNPNILIHTMFATGEKRFFVDCGVTSIEEARAFVRRKNEKSPEEAPARLKVNRLPPHPGSEGKTAMNSEQPLRDPNRGEPKVEMRVPEELPYAGETIYCSNDPKKKEDE